jgi:cobalt/nickel transport system permease protein
VLALSAVVLLQAFLFSDGGITVLGANLVNMALLGPAAAWPIYRLCERCGIRTPVAAGLGAWAAILAGAAACAMQLVFSATAASGILPLMTGVHALIGLVEGVVTALAVGAVIRLRGMRPVQEGMPLPLAGMLAAIATLAVFAPFACGWPDGLEFAAERHVWKVASAGWQTPFSDYAWLGRDGDWWTVLVACFGAGITFATAWLIGRSCRMGLARRRCGNG